MKLALIALVPAVLIAQNTVIVIPRKGINPNIPMQAGQGVTPLETPLESRNKALQNKLLREQAELLKAQREALSNSTDINYKNGYEEGALDGYKVGYGAASKEFEANISNLKTDILTNMARAILTDTDPDDLSRLIADLGPVVQQNPDDYLNKAFLVLYRYRLEEIKPKPAVTQSVKPKKKTP